MARREISSVNHEIVYGNGFIKVRRDTVVYADGNREDRDILEVPEGVLVLPVTDDGNIILTKEFRHNHGYTYGVPMGKKDEGEDPAQAAQRELREEIGYSANKWTHISTHHNGIHEEGVNHYFVAQELSEGDTSMEEDEDIEKIEMTFEEAFKLMQLGQIVEVRSRGCIWAAYIYLMSGYTFSENE